MAKKSVSTAEPEAVEQETPSISLAGAIREALSELGLHATRSEVVDWISAKYPQLKFQRESTPSRDWSASSGEGPVNAELMRIKQLVEERGGVEKIARLIEQVDELADEVGGVDVLREAVAALKRWDR